MQAEIIDEGTGRGSRQAVLRFHTPQGPVVVKRFGLRRGRLRLVLKQIGHWTFAGKSPAGAAGRRRTEADCLALWARHGFDVFRRIRDADLPPIAEPHLVLEFVEGRTLYDILQDPGVVEAEKEALLERFAPEWRRRHALALERSEPRLLHEHGSFRHVWVAGERLITFDLEIAWQRRRLTAYLVGREIAAFLRSLGRASGPDRFETRLARLVAAYGDPRSLRESVRRVRRSRDPIRRLAFRLERLLDRRDPYRPDRVLGRVAALVGD
jgi:hypothetical protein